MVAPLVLFALTYVAISVRRLPWIPIRRPSAALAGAVAMILFGGLSLEGAFRAIDLRTITLLLGMLVISGYLDLAVRGPDPRVVRACPREHFRGKPHDRGLRGQSHRARSCS